MPDDETPPHDSVQSSRKLPSSEEIQALTNAVDDYRKEFREQTAAIPGQLRELQSQVLALSEDVASLRAEFSLDETNPSTLYRIRTAVGNSTSDLTSTLEGHVQRLSAALDECKIKIEACNTNVTRIGFAVAVAVAVVGLITGVFGFLDIKAR